LPLKNIRPMLTIDPKDTPLPKLHGYILGAVAPRPIAFASTIDKKNNPNLSPFSFFNAFSANPPICIFSPARRARDNTAKHTYENAKEVGEVVINMVNYDIVQQVSLASTEYAKGVNEFIKAGLTPIPSEIVKPFRVKESPVQMECRVKDIIELGNEGGAGNLVICEILLMHISEDILDEKGIIDPQKIDLVSRMGGNWYCRASGDALFEVEKPLTTLGLGVDAIPSNIRNSEILTGNNLGQLGNIEVLPTKEEIAAYRESAFMKDVFDQNRNSPQKLEREIHLKAKAVLDDGNITDAWKILLSINRD